jgi:hypothetical protein
MVTDRSPWQKRKYSASIGSTEPGIWIEFNAWQSIKPFASVHASFDMDSKVAQTIGHEWKIFALKTPMEAGVLIDWIEDLTQR